MDSEIKYFINQLQDNRNLIFVDVGAMGGIALKWDCLRSAMKIIAFEPDEREFIKLKNEEKISYFNYALNDQPMDLVYNIAEGRGKSSVFYPNMDFLSRYKDVNRFKIVRETIIPSEKVKNLDYFFEKNLINDADFIKLDTQGSELSILIGGQNSLIPRIFGAQIEVEFAEVYEKQPLFRDIDKFMDAKGFLLIDIRRMYWKRKDYYDYKGKGQLIFGDVLYFKKPEIFLKELADLKDTLSARQKIFKAVLICLVYKMFDYAVSLVESGLELEYLTIKEREEAISRIKNYSRKGFFAKMCLHPRIYNICESVLRKLKPLSYLGWADADNDIGNIKDE